jgi:hypothetical protein
MRDLNADFLPTHHPPSDFDKFQHFSEVLMGTFSQVVRVQPYNREYRCRFIQLSFKDI